MLASAYRRFYGRIVPFLKQFTWQMQMADDTQYRAQCQAQACTSLCWQSSQLPVATLSAEPELSSMLFEQGRALRDGDQCDAQLSCMAVQTLQRCAV